MIYLPYSLLPQEHFPLLFDVLGYGQALCKLPYNTGTVGPALYGMMSESCNRSGNEGERLRGLVVQRGRSLRDCWSCIIWMMSGSCNRLGNKGRGVGGLVIQTGGSLREQEIK